MYMEALLYIEKTFSRTFSRDMEANTKEKFSLVIRQKKSVKKHYDGKINYTY